jgi:hypothetical protein
VALSQLDDFGEEGAADVGAARRDVDTGRQRQPEPAERGRGRGAGWVGQRWFRGADGLVEVAVVQDRAHQFQDQAGADPTTFCRGVVQPVDECQSRSGGVRRCLGVAVAAVVGGGAHVEQGAFDAAGVLGEVLVGGEQAVGFGQRVFEVVAAADMGGAGNQLAEGESAGGRFGGFGLQHGSQNFAACQWFTKRTRARRQRDPHARGPLDLPTRRRRAQSGKARFDSLGVPPEADESGGQERVRAGPGRLIGCGDPEHTRRELNSQFRSAPPQSVGHVHECVALGGRAAVGW